MKLVTAYRLIFKMNMDTLATMLFPVFPGIARPQKVTVIWKTAFLILLLKSGSRCSIDNTQHINLLPKISIFERFMFTLLYDSSKNINPKQFGFQSNKNSTFQLLHYIGENYKLHWNVCRTVFLDYSKALTRCLSKSYNANLLNLALIPDFKNSSSHLSNHRQIILLNGLPSDATDVISGVPQGSVLGPLSFLLVIYDLPLSFLDCHPCLFADNLKLLFTSANFHGDLTRLYNRSLANGLLANASKNMTLTFRGSIVVDCELDNLENVNEHDDLSWLNSSDLKWTEHIRLQN